MGIGWVAVLGAFGQKSKAYSIFLSSIPHHSFKRFWVVYLNETSVNAGMFGTSTECSSIRVWRDRPKIHEKIALSKCCSFHGRRKKMHPCHRSYPKTGSKAPYLMTSNFQPPHLRGC